MGKEEFLKKYPVEIYGSTMLKVMQNDLFRMEMTEEDLKYLRELNMIANEDFELYEDLALNYITQGTTDFFTENEIARNELSKYLQNDLETSIATGSKEADLTSKYDYVQSQIRAWTTIKHDLEQSMDNESYDEVQRKTSLAQKIENYADNYIEDDKKEEHGYNKDTQDALDYFNRLIDEGISER